MSIKKFWQWLGSLFGRKEKVERSLEEQKSDAAAVRARAFELMEAMRKIPVSESDLAPEKREKIGWFVEACMKELKEARVSDAKTKEIDNYLSCFIEHLDLAVKEADETMMGYAVMALNAGLDLRKQVLKEGEPEETEEEEAEIDLADMISYRSILDNCAGMRKNDRVIENKRKRVEEYKEKLKETEQKMADFEAAHLGVRKRAEKKQDDEETAQFFYLQGQIDRLKNSLETLIKEIYRLLTRNQDYLQSNEYFIMSVEKKTNFEKDELMLDAGKKAKEAYQKVSCEMEEMNRQLDQLFEEMHVICTTKTPGEKAREEKLLANVMIRKEKEQQSELEREMARREIEKEKAMEKNANMYEYEEELLL
jgi:hypothetical protein